MSEKDNELSFAYFKRKYTELVSRIGYAGIVKRCVCVFLGTVIYMSVIYCASEIANFNGGPRYMDFLFFFLPLSIALLIVWIIYNHIFCALYIGQLKSFALDLITAITIIAIFLNDRYPFFTVQVTTRPILIETHVFLDELTSLDEASIINSYLEQNEWTGLIKNESEAFTDAPCCFKTEISDNRRHLSSSNTCLPLNYMDVISICVRITVKIANSINP